MLFSDILHVQKLSSSLISHCRSLLEKLLRSWGSLAVASMYPSMASLFALPLLAPPCVLVLQGLLVACALSDQNVFSNGLPEPSHKLFVWDIRSSIVSLIERFYDPLSGCITLDDIDIKSLNLTWYRQQIALVSQVSDPTVDSCWLCGVPGGRKGAV